jgi:hypothetical protein
LAAAAAAGKMAATATASKVFMVDLGCRLIM